MLKALKKPFNRVDHIVQLQVLSKPRFDDSLLY